jgi:hypothetical protein
VPRTSIPGLKGGINENACQEEGREEEDREEEVAAPGKLGGREVISPPVSVGNAGRGDSRMPAKKKAAKKKAAKKK